MKLEIVDAQHPALRAKAKPVKKLDKKTKDLITEMKDILVSQKDPEGVGLAAPQIGKSLQIFIMHYPKIGLDKKAIINPKLKRVRKKPKKQVSNEDSVLEGCLSIPHYYGPLQRAKEVTIEYMDEDGKNKIETFRDFAAQIVLHEMDHLNGILFIDHIMKHDLPLYKIRGNEVTEIEI